MKTFDLEHFCELCFAEKNEKQNRCSFCDGISNAQSFPTALREGTILVGKYLVGRVLGKGGFGVTYLCYDLKNQKKVAIKEFVPDTLVFRNAGETAILTSGEEKGESFREGVKRFYEEARTVSSLNGNPNIINVFEFFYQNNTAYFVMEYLEGLDLKRYVKKKGTFTEAQALYVLHKALDALAIVHRERILHRDIKPDNIYICNDGNIKLIDFGAARQMLGEVSKSLSVILTQGFAPLEQYQKRGKQGPWTDIYALGATVYYMVTGNVIDDAMSRLDGSTLDMSAFSEDFGSILNKMLEVSVDDRYQSTEDVKKALLGVNIVPEPIILGTQMTSKEKQIRIKAKSNGWLKPVVAVASVLVVASVVGTALYLGRAGDGDTDVLDERELHENVETLMTDTSIDNAPQTEEPEAENPEAENPEAEEPDVGEPEADEPKEEPKEEPEVEEPEVEEPEVEEPEVEEPEVEEPKVEEPKEEPKQEKPEPKELASGKCGDNINWKLTDDGVFTLSGSGKTYDYGDKQQPWYDQREVISKVVISNGITGIGIGVFRHCSAIESITIPDDVKSIGDSAFNDCSALKSIILPEGMTNIGYNAFNETAFSKDDNNWKDNILCIGNYLIRVSTSVKGDFTVKAGTKIIAGGAFNGCTSVGSITIPDSVICICNSAFNKCTALNRITIPNSVTRIGASAFYECTSLKNITIPTGVKSIEKYTFYQCNSLIDITVPNGVTSVDEYAFYNCGSLERISLPAGVTSIGKYAFGNSKRLVDITIPEKVTEIGEYAFYNTAINKITIPNGVKSINKYTFYSCTSLSDVTIPNGVNYIGEGAFRDCKALETVTIPGSVTKIDGYTFRDSGLKDIYAKEFASKPSGWDANWLKHCEAAVHWKEEAIASGECGDDIVWKLTEDGVLTLSGSGETYDYADRGQPWYENRGIIVEAVVSEGITGIGDGVFRNCNALKSITVPNSVTSIGEFAFCHCSALSSITIPSGVTNIARYAFCHCKALTNVMIPDSVTEIEEYAFSDCTGITSLSLSKSLKNIEKFVFSDCKSLISITIPESVESIGEYALSGCYGLENIIIGTGVKRIEQYAFYCCSMLTEIEIPNGVNYIGGHAFENCTDLSSITIPDSVTDIGEYVFKGCSNSMNIHFEGRP